MKKIISIAIFFILSTFIQQVNINEFNSFEAQLNKNGEFIENGVKLIYQTTNTQTDELNRMLKEVENEIDPEAVEVKNNSISYEMNNIKCLISIWQESETKVSIQIINSNNNYSTKNLLDKVNKLTDSSSLYKKVYKYTKVETEIDFNNEINFLDENVEINSEVTINNGKVMNGTLQDGTEVNLAHMKYNTGNYVIVGTPMIFVTY